MALTEQQVQDALAAIVDSGAASYSIGNRSVSKLSPTELYELSKKVAFDADRAANGVFRLAKMVKPQ